MRATCGIKIGDQICGEPAVEYIEAGSRKLWMCAQHYDNFCQACKRISEDLKNALLDDNK